MVCAYEGAREFKANGPGAWKIVAMGTESVALIIEYVSVSVSNFKMVSLLGWICCTGWCTSYFALYTRNVSKCYLLRLT